MGVPIFRVFMVIMIIIIMKAFDETKSLKKWLYNNEKDQIKVFVA